MLFHSLRAVLGDPGCPPLAPVGGTGASSSFAGFQYGSSQCHRPGLVADLRIQQEFLYRNHGVELVRAEGIHLEGTVNEVNTIMMGVGGIAPDMISMNFRSTGSFVRKGIVMPLDSFLESETPEASARILARLPSNLGFSGIYFDRDLFQKAGLPPRAPRT